MILNLPPAPQHLTRLKVLLARTRHFDGLPPEVQERIAASASPRHFAAGRVIYVGGEPAESFYLLERGWVKAMRMSRDGREQAMLFLESGEIFGDIAVFSGTTYAGTVAVLEDVDVWTIPADEFLELTKQYPALAMAGIRHLSDRVLHYIGLVEDLSLRNVETRWQTRCCSMPKCAMNNRSSRAAAEPHSMKWPCASGWCGMY